MVALEDRLDMVLGKPTATKLADELGYHTVGELIRHYPRRYSDGMTVHNDGEEQDLEDGRHVTLVGVITKIQSGAMKPVRGKNNRMRYPKWVRMTLGDHRPPVTAAFFHAAWMIGKIDVGTRIMLSGEVKHFRGNMELVHPAFLVLDSQQFDIGTRSMRMIAKASGADGQELLSEFEKPFFPIYPATSRLQTWDIYRCIHQVLDVLDPIADPLPKSFVREHHLMTEDEAVRAVHLADSDRERTRATERLTFDEAIGLQWGLVERRHSVLSEAGPPAPPRADGLATAMAAQLPFELTAGQRDVLEVITGELAAPRPMNRMLQGEVGSGKTVVALLAMLQMHDAGYQCALLAPTEVLAAQHVHSMRAMLGPLGNAGEFGADDNATKVTLLTGSMTAPQKRAARAEVASGEAGIVVGTHALLQDTVQFHRLGMVVVDEQHRFGVEQRDRLRAKAPEGITPHLLVMTATPIPRTVALAVYGDLEISTLRELPRGRQPITTNTIFVGERPRWLHRAFERIAEEVRAGRQAYVVASRIDEDHPPAKKGSKKQEDSDKAEDPDKEEGEGPPPITVLALMEQLQGEGPLSDMRLGLMHGRLPSDEKDAVMAAFRAGKIDVLVCTTVIEVGVDVPNATVMLVMDADRFGISQLHQLRGRIGRGTHPSLCLLATWRPEKSKAGKRLKAVASTL
ncbi:ATP-dependent DNA helicase RecG, partial [Mycolicibacterium sp.]|uniref:ATP-dependent DNA helicase RecG n=1 Tax=Mycolicibacterium sp. TaxID=2320850 RepID=UPI003D0E5067